MHLVDGKKRSRMFKEVLTDRKIMSKFSPQPSGPKSDLGPQFTKGMSQVSQPTMIIRLSDIYNPKPESERKPVRIRPPSPRSPSPMESTHRRSLSCEATPKPIMRRRAQSLPSTPNRRPKQAHMQVRFADSLGLELEKVKVFKVGEDPLIPHHVLSRLLMNSELFSGKDLELSLPYFKPSFPEDIGAQPGFLERLRGQKVCLERVLCSDVGIIGTAQVLNLAFEKEVTVHYSFTDWKSTAETKASWVAAASSDRPGQPEADVFRFRLPVPPFILQPGATLEFAIRFQVMRAEYWDNNGGNNYKLTCQNYKLSVPRECEDSMVHFI
ncbi:protein phosphatase 1, regulatory subunit 3Db isoform X1 [Alosa pseudoharengus]|uniref:protein phosphatase 1, regulatory subunit 3Db isoform X1 n=2 Tax=Alosa pseudoharengus TaxID=34774 RepID=UPI003F894C12